MRMRQSSAGFTVVEIVLAIVAIGAFIGVVIIGIAAIKQADNKVSQNEAAGDSPVVRAKDYFRFSDLDIKFEKTDSNKNMSFKASKDANAIYFAYDSTLSTLAKKCYASEAQEVSFSSIVRNEGYENSSNESIVAKQFDTFNITLQKPTDISPCIDVEHQDSFLKHIADLQQQLEYSIRGAEKL